MTNSTLEDVVAESNPEGDIMRIIHYALTVAFKLSPVLVVAL